MAIESIRHKNENRPHIPSQEEAGMEAASPKVKKDAALRLTLNPVVTRGQDPELYWLDKYGSDNSEEQLSVDIRSLYRYEHISPELIIKRLYKMKEEKQGALFSVNELFGNAIDIDELEKISDYYQHQDGWTNRLILGDNLLAMTSLLEREGMKNKVQCIYVDPPYGIKYKSNWQIKLNSLEVKDGIDDNLTAEPEQIKAYRDTWELGIHSYLSYMRERLLVCRELLAESGSCFVQISDENVHLIRGLMDEVFGSGNFVSMIFFQKTGGFAPSYLSNIGDHILWYSKNRSHLKYRQLYLLDEAPTVEEPYYVWLQLSDGSYRRMTKEEKRRKVPLPEGARIFRLGPLQSQGASQSDQRFEFQGEVFQPSKNSHWKVTLAGLENLAKKGLLLKSGTKLYHKLFWDYFPASELQNVWLDTQSGGFVESGLYVVQTTTKVIQRCILMATDPGDLVIDPTCGSGTTAFVCELWGRRWITIDTSRIAINVAKTRLLTASFPYFKLSDEQTKDIRKGFRYSKVSHVQLEDLANDEPSVEATLCDDAEPDTKRLRVAGPFTIETLQSYDPIPPEELEQRGEFDSNFEKRIFDMLSTTGIRNGARNEQAIFSRIERLPGANIHAVGWFKRKEKGKEREAKAYFHIGQKFSSVSKRAVSEAAKETRSVGDADWLVILGFAFDSDLDTLIDKSMGTYEISKVRMNDDLLQEGLLKKDKKAAAFVTIGEPDIDLKKLKGGLVAIEIKGLDIYDPIKDIIKPRDLHDIAYWMVDDDYDGSNFIVRQVFFCGGDKDEFDRWKKGLELIAFQKAKKNLQDTLKIEIDDEAFERLYGFVSHPITISKKDQKIAVRVVSQFGEESTKILSVAGPNKGG